MAGKVQYSTTGNGVSRRRYQPMAEINVTPFVDVMLVLLIVFMVTAPLLTIGVPVNLPEAAARPLPDDTRPIEITINQNGAIFLGDEEIAAASLIERLRAIAGNREDPRIYIRGDRTLSYGLVMEVMGAVNGAGYRRVALIADQPKRR